MFWTNSTSRLVNLSRRKLLATAPVYALSMTVRSSSAAGEETKTSNKLSAEDRSDDFRRDQ